MEPNPTAAVGQYQPLSVPPGERPLAAKSGHRKPRHEGGVVATPQFRQSVPMYGDLRTAMKKDTSSELRDQVACDSSILANANNWIYTFTLIDKDNQFSVSVDGQLEDIVNS